MQPLSPRPAHALLRCPVCRRDLSQTGSALACAAGHNYDLARSGYVNLLSGRARRPAAGGDTKEQLEHRAAFLAAGHFDFIAAAILDYLRASGRASLSRDCYALEAGCGTGDYLDRIVVGLSRAGCWHGLGLDLSTPAIRLASRRHRTLAFATADLWRSWPLRSAGVDVVLSVFAPKNFAEMARVLRPDGVLALVYPAPDHLSELRRDFGLMGIAPGKAAAYGAAVRALFGETQVRRVDTILDLGGDDVQNVMLMGPNGPQLSGHAVTPPAGITRVSCVVDLLFAACPNPERLGAGPRVDHHLP